MNPQDMVFNSAGKVRLITEKGEERWAWPVDAKEIVRPGSSFQFDSKTGKVAFPKAEAPKSAEKPKEAAPAVSDKKDDPAQTAESVSGPAPRPGAVRGSAK